MASNDGSRLMVFGLTFREYDSRHMQQILRSYARLPSNPGNRAALFTGLFDLARDLEEDEAFGISNWLSNSGHPDDFPTPRPSSPIVRNDFDDQSMFEEYNPADFEEQNAIVEDAGPEGDEYGVIDEPAIPSFPQEAQYGTNPEDGEIDGMAMDLDIPQMPHKEPEKIENECSICCEAMASADMLIPSKLTSTCDHDQDRRSCFPCMANHIGSILERNALNDINCPFCDKHLSSQEIKKYATPADFARYEYLVFTSRPDTVMCLAISCGKGQTYTDTTDPKMICNTCSFAICVPHKLPWHEGMTCEEFDCDDSQIERLEQAEATAKLLVKDQSKICPSCKQGVTRQEGCDHLTCMCGKSWCFICLVSWDNIMALGQEAHAPTCDHHPRKRQKTKAQQDANQKQLTESVLGKPMSEALLRARNVRNEKIRADIRPKALEAAEARMKAEQQREMEKRNLSPHQPKKKTRLIAPWEER